MLGSHSGTSHCCGCRRLCMGDWVCDGTVSWAAAVLAWVSALGGHCPGVGVAQWCAGPQSCGGGRPLCKRCRPGPCCDEAVARTATAASAHLTIITHVLHSSFANQKSLPRARFVPVFACALSPFFDHRTAFSGTMCTCWLARRSPDTCSFQGGGFLARVNFVFQKSPPPLFLYSSQLKCRSPPHHHHPLSLLGVTRGTGAGPIFIGRHFPLPKLSSP